MVDAGLREMYVTGRMHNRVRMVVASYLTKHLMTHWRVGLDWFADCLTDWDPASNAMGWQWVAGCGPDAAACPRDRHHFHRHRALPLRISCWLPHSNRLGKALTDISHG